MGVLLWAAWQRDVIANLFSVDQNVECALPPAFAAVRHPQCDRLRILDRHIEREPAFACASMAAPREKRSRVLSLFVEVALRLHLARLGKSNRGCLKILLLL